jgi:hypothetical protein
MEKRARNRHALMREVRCHTARGQSLEGQMTDLSASGCRFYSQRTPLGVGEIVSVRIEGLEGVEGRVRWVEGPVMGIRFERPLYEPVVEHLASKPVHARGGNVR